MKRRRRTGMEENDGKGNETKRKEVRGHESNGHKAIKGNEIT